MGFCLKIGLLNGFVASGLVDGYAKFSDVGSAEKCFKESHTDMWVCLEQRVEEGPPGFCRDEAFGFVAQRVKLD